METKRTCFICGKPLEADAPQGLCPACLLQGAFPTGTDTGGAALRFRPPTVAELAPKFPHLELLDFVGQGGMGAVYRARQKDLDRIVALKILPPDIGKDAAFAERFMREARALGRLNHPGIVTIYDFGRVDGLYFFLMEYVDGVSLRQLLGGSRLSTREALAIVPQICDALQYAHDQRIIHRDIKPENILLDRRGRVKVADFGLAKIMGSAGQGGQPEQASNPEASGQANAATEKPGPETVLTDSLRVVGTPAYMSPEQREHPAEVDHRADIYALGVVFYQMLTGELPGRKLEPPSRKVEIDVRLDEVVMRALEKQPERRYRQVSEVKSQVETINSTLDANASPVPLAEVVEPPVMRHWGWLLALGAVVGVLALMFWRSFLPDEILFSNDRPLGQLHTAWARLPDGLTGRWADLNYLGFNGGSEFVSFTTLLMWLLGPLGSAKFLAPLSLFVLGLCSWFAFRRLGLRQGGAILGALAVVLNSTFFSMACWGITQNVLGIGMSYLALGLVIWGRQVTRRWEQQTLYVLAGLASGVGILEAFEIGMLCSLVVLAYVIWDGVGGKGTWWERLVRGVKPALWVTAFMALVAGQPMISSFQPATGVDRTNPETRWNWATEWSLPKQEAAALVIPGLFGYRMDTPGGGQYWGGLGRSPELDAWMDGDRKEPQPVGPNILRFTGGGNYLGVMVILVALWAAVRAFRRNDAVFTRSERRWIWFWSSVAVVCLLLAFGRFAPFYRWLYALPFFDTQRNPVRFLEPMTLAVSMLFACGLLGLWRQYLAAVEVPSLTLRARLKTWWREGSPHDRHWALGCVVAVAVSLASWAAYAHFEGTLRAVLETVGFSDGSKAQDMAAFSVRQVGWFVLFLALGGGLLVLIWSGLCAGKGRWWVGWLLGLLLLADLGRANRPWLVYWNYPQKYATNDVLQFLRQKPYEHRVARLPFPAPDAESGLFANAYAVEWSQHQFPYYDIQSLDMVQMSRMPNDLLEFKTAMSAHDSATLQRLAREWQLTNTRYLLGPVAFLDGLNDQLDPVKRRFRVAQTFDFVPASHQPPRGSDPLDLLNLPSDRLAAVFKPHGRFAIFEFTGALPRASLYSRWQVSTNDPVVLAQLADPSFDPQQTVLVDGTSSSELPAEGPGDGGNSSVDITSYSPKEIVLKTQAKLKTVMLLNDRYDPQWTVTVDNRPAPLLRCNYIMRGVQVPAGEHTVCFSFHVKPGLPLPHFEVQPDSQSVSLVFHVSNGVTSYVTLAAYGVGFVLVAILVADRLRQRRKTATTSGNQR